LLSGRMPPSHSQQQKFHFGTDILDDMDLDRFAKDTPEDDAPSAADVCVVATQPDTFQRCRDGIYPSPATYPRTERPFSYLALYRTAPVSAITHYARITARTPQTRGEQGPLTPTDWKQLIDPFSDCDSVIVFEFESLIPLEDPVKNDQQGVRGAWYTDIGALRESTTISELAAVAETH
jgi:hypothetical protein